jgi:hypothetical protein
MPIRRRIEPLGSEIGRVDQKSVFYYRGCCMRGIWCDKVGIHAEKAKYLRDRKKKRLMTVRHTKMHNKHCFPVTIGHFHIRDTLEDSQPHLKRQV